MTEPQATPPTPGRWPFPQDTAVQRAQAIARSFRDALAEYAPERAEELERLAQQFGEAWVATCVVAPADGLLTEDELAQRLGVSRSQVRNMVERGVGPGSSRGEGRRLTRHPGGFDAAEAEELRAWAQEQSRRGDVRQRQ